MEPDHRDCAESVFSQRSTDRSVVKFGLTPLEYPAWRTSRLLERLSLVDLGYEMTAWGQYLTRLGKRRLACLLLLSVCASIFPMPLPAARLAKDTSQPFPCQNRPCGCRSAEQCWKRCCCFTNTQKVAWAKSKRVVIPHKVHVAAAQEARAAQSTSATCCAEKADKRQCAIAGKTTSRKAGPAESLNENAEEPVDYVISILAEQCRGQSTYWNSLPWAIVCESPVATTCHPVLNVLPDLAALFPSIFLQPPVPPPRFVAPADLI